jgi:hypothetical protein
MSFNEVAGTALTEAACSVMTDLDPVSLKTQCLWQRIIR